MVDIDCYQLLVYQLTTSGVSRDWVGIVLKCNMGPLLLTVMRVHRQLAQDSQEEDMIYFLHRLQGCNLNTMPMQDLVPLVTHRLEGWSSLIQPNHNK